MSTVSAKLKDYIDDDCGNNDDDNCDDHRYYDHDYHDDDDDKDDNDDEDERSGMYSGSLGSLAPPASNHRPA